MYSRCDSLGQVRKFVIGTTDLNLVNNSTAIHENNESDGVSAQEGRLLFATTNQYSALDPALTRPGRMDLHVEFVLAIRD